MSYAQQLRGEIRIEPPLTWEEYKDGPFVRPPGGWGYHDSLALKMERAIPVNGAPELSCGGPEFVAVALQVTGSEYYDDAMDNVFSDFIRKHVATHRFTGHIILIGEEQGDLTRYTVNGTDIVTDEARLVWSDGTEIDHDDYCL